MELFNRAFQKLKAVGSIAALLILQSAVLPLSAAAQNNLLAPFTPGNLVVYRVGNGTDPLSSAGSAVFLDEYTPTGTLVQSIALPTTASGENRQLIANGTSSSEGFITRSADGRYLIVTGYARNLGGTGAVSGTTPAEVPRVVGRIDANGVINTTTAITDTFSGANIRSAISANGTDFWVTGSANGVRYVTLGASTTTQINTGANAVTNLRQISIFNNQLYFSTGSGTNPRIAAVGNGLPTTTGQDTTPLANVPGNGSPYGFFFADLSAAVPGVDTLYVADDTTTGGTGGIQKYSLVGGVWTANGVAGMSADSYRGLTGVVSGTTVTLYATRKGGTGATGGGELVRLVDSTGYNMTISGEPTLLATAAPNTAFRGVVLAPTGGDSAPKDAPVDFNGDGRSDDVVVGAQRGNPSPLLYWYIQPNGGAANSNYQVQWGLANDRLVPEDYDGDGKDDIAVWRVTNNGARGYFFILRSTDNTFQIEQFGTTGDDPSVVGDYDGDNRADVAVYRRAGSTAPMPCGTNTGVWFYRPVGTPAGIFKYICWGAANDITVPGDYDGDNKMDAAVFRETTGTFHVAKSGGGTEAVVFGASGDVTVPGDYDGDGRTDYALARRNTAQWTYFIRTQAGALQTYQFGATSTDTPAPGDYTGDGKTDIALWRSTDGTFYIRPAQTSGTADFAFKWGQQGDFPAAGYIISPYAIATP
jgi:hypothetical protein